MISASVNVFEYHSGNEVSVRLKGNNFILTTVRFLSFSKKLKFKLSRFDGFLKPKNLSFKTQFYCTRTFPMATTS